MFRFPAVLLVPACLLLVMLGAGWSLSDANAEPIGVEPVVWTFGEDYPGAQPEDAALGVQTVYIKTHDGTDWMSVYDSTPGAISGPDSLRQVIESYGARGITVVAWFVPKGTDVEGQLDLAKQVLDTGVQGLYADLEPFEGFCYLDCGFLAREFWWRLRAERPGAHLGVIYDPRPQWWAQSATADWFAAADVALPMCYWDSYADQGVWADPVGCVRQAYSDLSVLSPGRALQYVPMLEGYSSGDAFRAALDAAASVGTSRVSIWRRGIMTPEVWAVVASRSACPRTRADACLLADESNGRVYVFQGGAKFYIPSPEVFAAMGLDPAAVANISPEVIRSTPDIPRDGTFLKELSSPDIYLVAGGARFRVPNVPTLQAMMPDPSRVRVVPDGALNVLPFVPGDGAVLKETTSPDVYVVYGGARFHVPDPVKFAEIGLRWADVRQVPPGSLQQVPLIPRNRTWFTELGSGRHWLVQGGVKFSVDSSELRNVLVQAGQMDPLLFVVSPGAMDQVPDVDAALKSAARPRD